MYPEPDGAVLRIFFRFLSTKRRPRLPFLFKYLEWHELLGSGMAVGLLRLFCPVTYLNKR